MFCVGVGGRWPPSLLHNHLLCSYMCDEKLITKRQPSETFDAGLISDGTQVCNDGDSSDSSDAFFVPAESSGSSCPSSSIEVSKEPSKPVWITQIEKDAIMYYIYIYRMMYT
jgi:hypothetical protein